MQSDESILNRIIHSSRYHPHCIKHYPGAVLDAVVSAPINGVQVDPHATTSSLAFNNFKSEFFSSDENDIPQCSTTTLRKLVFLPRCNPKASYRLRTRKIREYASEHLGIHTHPDLQKGQVSDSTMVYCLARGTDKVRFYQLAQN